MGAHKKFSHVRKGIFLQKNIKLSNSIILPLSNLGHIFYSILVIMLLNQSRSLLKIL